MVGVFILQFSQQSFRSGRLLRRGAVPALHHGLQAQHDLLRRGARRGIQRPTLRHQVCSLLHAAGGEQPKGGRAQDSWVNARRAADHACSSQTLRQWRVQPSPAGPVLPAQPSPAQPSPDLPVGTPPGPAAAAGGPSPAGPLHGVDGQVAALLLSGPAGTTARGPQQHSTTHPGSTSCPAPPHTHRHHRQRSRRSAAPWAATQVWAMLACGSACPHL